MGFVTMSSLPAVLSYRNTIVRSHSLFSRECDLTSRRYLLGLQCNHETHLVPCSVHAVCGAVTYRGRAIAILINKAIPAAGLCLAENVGTRKIWR